MSHFLKLFLSTALLVVVSFSAYAQKTIRGTVIDAETGETLPSANISIEGTYRGTISNRNGNYSLTIPDSLLPATVVVRYIGFQSQKRRIQSDSETRQDFILRPSVTQLEAITVTDEDPAVRIMRAVIKQKQQWREKLDTYRAEAYTRQTLSNDTSIVMITESVSTAFWDKQQGHREVLRSRRQTANISAGQNFAGISYLPNFYDDNIEIAEFKMVGVTHPDALKFYDFKLLDRTTMDKKTVYEIKVTPAKKLQPLFKGTIYVLDEEYALLEVSLRPNEVVTFPAPVKSFAMDYKQQFNNFGGNFWLPVDVRIDGKIKIKMVGLEFPLIQFRQLSRITDYRVNVPLPDSLYRREKLFSVDSASVDNDSLFVKTLDTVPLSDREEQAYQSLDSTATLEKAFKPSGFLARFIDDEEDEEKNFGSRFLNRIPGSITPKLRFNRVDELFAGLRYDIKLKKRLEVSVNGGYSTGYDEGSYGAGLGYSLSQRGWLRSKAGVRYYSSAATRYTSRTYEPAFTIPVNLLGGTDYYDYFRNEGVRLFSEWSYPQTNTSLTVTFTSEDHSSLTTNTAYDIWGRDNTPLVNPPVDVGHVNALAVEAGYNLDEEYALGVTGLNRFRVNIEHSGDWLQSDFSYTTYQLSLDWNFPTFYQRRFLSNTLDVKLSAGTFSGTLPLQKFGIIDAALSYFSPFGSLKTRRYRPYEGEQYLSLQAEHNFRTIPFEVLGLSRLVGRNIGLILFGGMAKTWISDTRIQQLQSGTGYTPAKTKGTHLEAGVSLNGIFGLFRIDFARRLDEPAFLVNVSVARIF